MKTSYGEVMGVSRKCGMPSVTLVRKKMLMSHNGLTHKENYVLNLHEKVNWRHSWESRSRGPFAVPDHVLSDQDVSKDRILDPMTAD